MTAGPSQLQDDAHHDDRRMRRVLQANDPRPNHLTRRRQEEHESSLICTDWISGDQRRSVFLRPGVPRNFEDDAVELQHAPDEEQLHHSHPVDCKRSESACCVNSPQHRGTKCKKERDLCLSHRYGSSRQLGAAWWSGRLLSGKCGRRLLVGMLCVMHAWRGWPANSLYSRLDPRQRLSQQTEFNDVRLSIRPINQHRSSSGLSKRRKTTIAEASNTHLPDLQIGCRQGPT